MNWMRAIGVLLLVLLSACAKRETIRALPGEAALSAGVAIPNDTNLAVYLPRNARLSRFFIGGQWWVMPGKALEESVSTVSHHYFPGSRLVEVGNAKPHGLLLVLHPEWEVERDEIRVVLRYRVLSDGSRALMEGEQSYSANTGNLINGDGFYNAAMGASQLVMLEVLRELKPSRAAYPERASIDDVSRRLLINEDRPVSTGTAFHINTSGQVVTAAHVVDGCVLIETERDGKALDAHLVAQNKLLDLAVLDTGHVVNQALPLRFGHELVLGEAVINVGFPLQGMLVASPNLTRGHVSSTSALEGALGQFQFSAAIQPGNSGGPVVSQEGQLLGITVGSLNPAALAEMGVVPQNVNFALNGKYLAGFLRDSRVNFQIVDRGAQGRDPIADALAAVVSIACYQ